MIPVEGLKVYYCLNNVYSIDNGGSNADRNR